MPQLVDLVRALSLAVLLAPNARALGSARTDELRSELASRDDQRVAWAARHAADEHVVELVPDLIERLGDFEFRQRVLAKAWLGDTVLDALIVLDARVPPPVLRPFFQSNGTCALVLAAREPRLHLHGLVDLVSRTEPAAYDVRLALLLRADPQLAAHEFIRTIVLRTELVVTNPNTPEWSFPAPELPTDARHDEPRVRYAIFERRTFDASTGAAAASGFGWRRHATGTAAILEGSFDVDVPAREFVGWTTFLSTWGGCERRVRLTTTRHGLDGALRRVRAELTAQRERWSELLRTFHARGWIEQGALQLAAPLEFALIDSRSHPRDDLSPFADEVRCELQTLRVSCAAIDAEAERSLHAGLASRDPRRVAWTAFAIAESRAGGFGLDLRSALSRRRQDSLTGDGRWTTLALLDALVETGTRMTSDELTHWWNRGVNAQLVRIAAQDPMAAREFLARSFDTPMSRCDAATIACCNLLATFDPQRCVEAALRHARPQLDVHVVEDTFESDLRCGTGGSSCSAGYRPPNDFPPCRMHVLTLPSTQAETYVADGTLRIGASRRVNEPWSWNGCEITRGLSPSDYFALTLSRMSGRAVPAAALVSGAWSQVLWSGDQAAFVREVRALHADVKRAWTELFLVLRDRGLLPVDVEPGAQRVRVWYCEAHVGYQPPFTEVDIDD